MKAILVPYHERYESFCPKCEGLAQEYHPVERWGYCAACHFAWRFPPYRKRWEPTPGIDFPGVRPKGER